MRKRFFMTMVGIFLMWQALFHYALDPQKKMTQYVHDVWGIEQGLPQNSVNAVIQTKDGYLWLGTQDGLARFDGVRFEVYDIRNVEQLEDNHIQALCEDRRGNLWIGTENGGLTCLNNGKFTTISKSQGLSNNRIKALYEDRAGSLWIGTENGLNRLDQKDGKITVYKTNQGLSNNMVYSICEDRAGNLWIGTDQGLNRYKAGKFTGYTTKDGLSNDMVCSVYEDRQGHMWIATAGGGLNRLDLHKKNEKFTAYTTKQGLSNDMAMCSCEDQEGSLWIGTWDGGLNCFRDGKFTVYTTREGLSDNVARYICEDRKGNLWIGTNGGLNQLNLPDFYKKDGKISFTTYTTKEGLSDNRIRSLYVDRQGNLWIGTAGGEVNRFKDGKFTVYPTSEELSNDISYFYEDREGNLWIGTSGGGLMRFKDGKFASITIKEGLFDNTVHQVLEDDRGNLWMSCNKGIFRVSKKELNEVCEGKRSSVHCHSYNEADGMKSRECNGVSQPSACKSHDGKLWFPTMKGVVMIDPQNIKLNRLPPPVKIEAITADNQKNQLPFSANDETLVFSPGSQRFEINYTALSLLVPEKVRFKCKLEGLDKEWLEVGTRRAAYYTKLPPGDYTFRVKACNNDGTWNEAGAAVSFYLKPYFYQAWWFYIMGAVGGLFLAFGIYRLRVKQITNLKIKLGKLVDERTRQLEESRKELEKLSVVASETHNAVTIMDANGNLEWMNAGATRMYGYTLEQVYKEIGRNIIEISSNPHIRELLNKFIAEPEPVLYESLYTTRAGKKIWTQSMWNPILDEEGNLTKIISIGSDISHIKQSKEQIDMQNERILKQSERLKEAIKIAREEREAADAANQAKSEFLARMSHEIRTPMNSVIGFSEMLMDTDLNDEQLDYAVTISRSGEALINIIDDILDFSRIEAGKLSFDSIDFDPEVMAFDVCELTRPRIEDRPVEILCRVADRVPAYVKQDPGRFRQVLVNLMGNAAKFTEKGEIHLSIDVEEEEADRLKLHVMVRDTGIGIPPEEQGAIFEIFQQVDGSVTRKFGGTGLGLAICKQIAKHMGGDIRVESTPGQGSTFHFYARVEKSKKMPTEEAVKIDLAGKRVLIVDDNRHNLDILEHILKKHGMSVVKLTGSETVIPILEENLGNGMPFDLCILDLRMPGLKGYEVARQIRALDSPVSKLPLLAYSSSCYRKAKKYREYGFDAFLPKPTRTQKLLKVIAQLLRPGKTGTERENQERRELITQHSVIEHAKHSVRILLAEDNPVNRKLAVFMLTKAGYGLDVAGNGKEVVEKYTSDPDKYDLIFMDIQMPEMDGKAAAKKIREIESDSHIPIIAMTAESMKGDREKCLEAGMDDYISKPIRREIVFEMIKKWMITKTDDEF